VPLPAQTSVCGSWPIDWTGDVSGVEFDLRDSAHEAASRVLWSLTGRRFGVCRVVRGPQPGSPYPGSCGLPPSRYEPRPDGEALWIDGENPVVHNVYIDETLMDQADWAQAGKWLIRLADGVWPKNTWSAPTALMVEMSVGYAPPVGSAQAVGEMAYELLRASRGHSCSLPDRVSSQVRQGVSMEMLDPASFVKDGLTGLSLCDRLIGSVNPARLSTPSRVISPDVKGWRKA
jgi:hypothetical protein